MKVESLPIPGEAGSAHLYPPYGRKPSDQPIGPDRRYPLCGKRVPLGGTSVVHSGRPCYDCLVQGITHPERTGVHPTRG